ncbi:hypothetical protein GCM10018789_59340 [Streptomyces werraensis]|nr:hypothetical protein GCM10018789_59340 [Streptomyces werraensis]
MAVGCGVFGGTGRSEAVVRREMHAITAASQSKRFDVAARLSEHLEAHKARSDNSCDGRTITREEGQES